MNKVIPLTKNHKDYEDVPDGLKWAIPIHECLEKPEVKERSRRLEEESKKRSSYSYLVQETGRNSVAPNSGWKGAEALAYWNLNTDGANKNPAFDQLKKDILSFKPDENLMISPEIQRQVCPAR